MLLLLRRGEPGQGLRLSRVSRVPWLFPSLAARSSRAEEQENPILLPLLLCGTGSAVLEGLDWPQFLLHFSVRQHLCNSVMARLYYRDYFDCLVVTNTDMMT
ncbi:hypothetical protein HGM15179_003033, partial [Zosterops borbonicus]